MNRSNAKTLADVFEWNRLDYNNTAFKTRSGVDGILKSVGNANTVYGKITYVLDVKEYDFNISTADTPTGSHRVFINLTPKAGKTNRNSQFPYYGGDK